MREGLPKCVYKKSGSYYLVKKNKWTRLGGSVEDALVNYPLAVSGKPLNSLPKLLTKDEIISRARQTAHCVYFLLSGEEIVYVGQSSRLHERLSVHRQRKDMQWNSYFSIECQDVDARSLEAAYIAALSPKYNLQHATNRSHLSDS